MRSRPQRALDRATLLGMAAGLAILLWPWWPRALEVGFFVMLFSTLAQIVVSHVPILDQSSRRFRAPPDGEGEGAE